MERRYGLGDLGRALLPNAGALVAALLALTFGAAARADELICHLPDAAIPQGKMRLVPESAVARHLAHGDALGICSMPEPSEMPRTLNEYVSIAQNRVRALAMADYDQKALDGLVGAEPKYDSDSIPPDLETIGLCVENEIAGLSIQGWAWALRRHDQTLTGSGGYARAPWEKSDPGVPMTPSQPMLIASVSKAIASAAVVKFFERFGVDIDDPVLQTVRDRISNADFVANFDLLRQNPVVLAALGGRQIRIGRVTFTLPVVAASTNEDVTFRDVLTHHSGYRDYYECDLLGVLSQFLAGPVLPIGVPGDYGQGGSAKYANMNFCILERTLEALVGNRDRFSFEAFLRSAVFVPAGIPDVTCEPREPRTLYYRSADLSEGTSRPGLPWGSDDRCATGGVRASALELLDFLNFLRSPANSAYFRHVYLDECIKEGLPDLNQWQKCTGLFRNLNETGLEAVHNGGVGDPHSGQGMESVIFRFPFDTDAVLMWNTAGASKSPEDLLRGCFLLATEYANGGVPNPG